MGDVPAGNTALAGDLYATLGWQLLLLVTVTALLAWRLWVRQGTGEGPIDSFAEPRGRRVLRISLGILWVIDGLLQAQPEMPSSFVAQTITPHLATAPDWLDNVITPFTRLWVQHPVASDAATVWIQVGLGIAIIVGGTGRLPRLVLWGSIGWAAFVWVVGELAGGLTAPDSTWLNGAPGAALLYLAAAVILLLPMSSWSSGAATRWVQRVVGVTLLLGATLQALPRSGYWTPAGISGVLSDAAAMGMPAPMASPVRWLATVVPAHAILANAALVLVLIVLGVGLLVGKYERSLSVIAAVLCFVGWWFGQGFGIFGGTGTDPSTGIMLLVLLAAGWPWPHEADLEPGPASERATASPRRQPFPRIVSVALAFGAVLVLPLAAAASLLGPQTAQAAVGDSGGVVLTSSAPAPDFTLTDQNGQRLSMGSMRGKLTLVVFLDPECFDSCPLMANQLATAVRGLGADEGSVSIVAVDVNPSFNAVQDVAAFTREHGLDNLASWHFVTGSNAEVGAVLSAFGQGVTVPAVGMIGHPQAVYLFGRNGEELAVLNDSANEDLTESYVQLITSELRHFL